jgi:hypothetical protein
MEPASSPEMLVPLSTERHGITLTFIHHDPLVTVMVTEFTEFSPVLMTYLWKCHSDITLRIIDWQNYIPVLYLAFYILLCLNVYASSQVQTLALRYLHSSVLSCMPDNSSLTRIKLCTGIQIPTFLFPNGSTAYAQYLH